MVAQVSSLATCRQAQPWLVALLAAPFSLFPVSATRRHGPSENCLTDYGMMFAPFAGESDPVFLVIIEKEQSMKNFQKILLSIGLASGAGACGIATLSVLAIIALSFGFELPFAYFQYLNAPMLAVTLPVVGMLALLPFALRQAFASEEAAPANDIIEIEARRIAVEEEHDEYHLKAA